MEQLLDLNANIALTPSFKGIEEATASYPAYLKLTERKSMLGYEVKAAIVYYNPETNTTMVYPFGDTTLYRVTIEELISGKNAAELKNKIQQVVGTRKRHFNHDEFIVVEGEALLTGIEAIDGAGDWIEKPMGPRMWLNPTTGKAEEVPEWRERRREKGVLFSC